MPSPSVSRPSPALSLLLWLPLLSFELVHPYPLDRFLLSPVLRRGFFLASLLYFGIVFALYVGSVVAARSVKRTRLAGTNVPWVASMTVPPLGSALLLWLHLSVQHGLYRHYHLDPEVGLLAAVLLAFAASTGAVVLIFASLPRRRAPLLAWILCLSAFGFWGHAVFDRFEVASSIYELIILTFCTISVVAILLRGSLAPFRRIPFFGGLAAGFAAVGVLLTLMQTGSGGAIGASSVQAAEPGVNVLMILVDTLRADHTQLGGYAKRTTPNLRRIAERRATYFSNATSAGASTIPSVKALFTGFPPSHFGADRGINFPPPPSAWTLARAFHEAGYRTAGFSANGLVDGLGFENGFDEFAAFGGHKYFRGSFFLFDLLSGRDYWESFREMARLHLHKEPAPNVRGIARDWLERHRGGRFFLYVQFLDPHWPYYDRGTPPLAADLRDVKPYSHVDLLRVRNGNPANARYRGTPALREMVARYDTEIAFVDRAIGRMFDDLRDLGLADSTLVVVLADHGEEFFEHDGYSHGHDVYQEQVHVPLLFRWPRLPEFDGAKARVDTPVSLVDVLPTLIDYLNLPRAPRPLFGTSLRPLVAGEEEATRPPVLSESRVPRGNRKAYRAGALKVRFSYPRSGSFRTAKDVSVFDLAADPREQRAISPTDPRWRAMVKRARHEIAEGLGSSETKPAVWLR